MNFYRGANYRHLSMNHAESFLLRLSSFTGIQKRSLILYHKYLLLAPSFIISIERILNTVIEEMLGSGAQLLSVTVSVNELCALDAEYPVLVSFGTRSLTGNGSDCEGQVNTTVLTMSPGDSVTFSVAADTVSLEENEEYCYIIYNAETGRPNLL